jgi:hypothetical protein
MSSVSFGVIPAKIWRFRSSRNPDAPENRQPLFEKNETKIPLRVEGRSELLDFIWNFLESWAPNVILAVQVEFRMN